MITKAYVVWEEKTMTYLELQKHVQQQICNYLCTEIDVSKYISLAVERTYICLSHSMNKYAVSKKMEDEIPFSVFNTVHYCIFLYQISRVAFEIDGNGQNAEKFYYLNKIMHTIDIFYEVELPKIWNAEHPIGSVMGRAKYSDYFFFYQGCTVGGNKGEYPTIGEKVIMCSDSKILGKAEIGDNVVISANTYIKDEVIPTNCMVFGQSPNLVIKMKAKEEMDKIITQILR